MRSLLPQGVRRLRRLALNRREVRKGTRPAAAFFQRELCDLLGCGAGWMDETAREYRDCPEAWHRLCGLRSPGAARDGEALTLDVAEGLVAWALVKHLRPRVVVELGTQFGVSARLWKEALARYVPLHQLILVDLKDERKFIRSDEAVFIQGDGRDALARILSSQRVDLLFNDAHPYELISATVDQALRHRVPALLFHDVGRGSRGLFRRASAAVPRAERARDDGPDYRTHGTWERHVMAETFGEALLDRDAVDTDTHRVRIFDSLFGLGAALRNP